MKKTTIAIILLIASLNNTYQAQTSTPSSKNYLEDINKIFPAAPTANNLMKFEEVPVSYYTGIPDINIPIFNFPTNNSKVSVNVQLKYHPLNAKPDDRSGETGLGWSLIAGGTISRTVRGSNPDEKNRTVPFSSPPRAIYGIYNETNNPTAKLINNENIDINDYAFNAAMGRYDTEYDLYQYNFAGNTGRFIVKKDSNGNYYAEKLDRNNLKIICNKDDATNIVNSFTIIDDKGIKYLFDGMEKSQKNLISVKTGLVTGTGGLNPSSEIGDYFAAFHLTKINDQSDVNLATFNYALSSTVKFDEIPLTTNRLVSGVQYSNTAAGLPNPEASMPGMYERHSASNISQTKLLTSIDLRGKGSIYFNYEVGRQDSNYTNPGDLYKLKSVQSNITGQSTNAYTDKYIFDYGYSNTSFQPNLGQPQNLKKMLLTKVTKVSPTDGNSEYSLNYNVSGTTLEKDPWGYYKGGITADVLNSMTYPTKGKVVFDFGENDYSNNAVLDGSGVEPVTGENVTQDYVQGVGFAEFNANDIQEFFTVDLPQTVNIHVDFGNLTYFDWNLTIYKKVGEQFTVVKVIPGFQQITCPTCIVTSPYPIDEDNPQLTTEQDGYFQFEPGTYYAALTKTKGTLNVPLSDYFSAHFTKTVFVEAINTNGDHSYSGGGLRINDITYYDSLTNGSFAKKYLYDYHDITQAQRSSGALVFPKPVFHYTESYSFKDKVNQPQITYSATFDTTTDFNILPVQKTQGSDVGYKYITVKQIDNTNNTKGKTVYTFRSPIDFPNTDALSAQMPVVPVPDYDFLRGQMVSEKKYDSNNLILSESTTSYVSTEYEKNSGIKIKDNFYNNMKSEYYQYSGYSDFASHFPGVILSTPYRNFEKFGVTLSTQKIEKSYFYKSGIQSAISISTNTIYNSNDYPSIVTQGLPDGETDVTSYKYATEKANQRLINANMIGISLETEAKQDNITINKTETIYANPANFLPSSILSYDILNGSTSYTEVNCDQYDSFGNLQQYTTKDGVSTTIIWGYNNTQPIAKIQGAKLTDIQQSLITSIVNASNSDASATANNDETTLLSNLNTFRISLPNYQVSTYTYDPLIGVRSVTPPSGISENYVYDSANKLLKIVDANGQVLKEFKYNYKN